MSELGRPFLPPDLRRLIQFDRQVGDPPPRFKREVAERLDRNLGLGGAMLASTPPVSLGDSPSTPPPPPSLATGVFGWKIAAGAMLAVVVGGAALFGASSHSVQSAGVAQPAETLGTLPADPWLRRADAPRSASDERSAPSSAANRASPARAVVLEQGAPRAGQRHHVASRRVSSSASLDTLTAERTVLDGARAALLRRDAAASLAALHSHERSFPRGQLLEERESMRIQALSLAGDVGAARSAGERFCRRYPRSMFLPVVEQILEADR